MQGGAIFFMPSSFTSQTKDAVGQPR